MAQKWEVVGGADKGGILIREGVDLKSPQCSDRLSTGAIVEQVSLVGDRLQYKLVSGTGPAEGWASVRISGKELLVKVGAASAAPTASGAVAVANAEVDLDLKEKVLSRSKVMEKELSKYVPKYNFLKYPLSDCKMRVICFHNAGSSESTFTGPGTVFMKWAKEANVEVIAVTYPGRDKVQREEKMTAAGPLSLKLLEIIYTKVADGVPYCVWAHSVGTWVAFEFLILARKIGLPMPKTAFLNAFPAPQLPFALRPWPQSRNLDSDGIKGELKKWDSTHFGDGGPGQIIFEQDWDTQWEPIMRADFRLYDEYEFTHAGAPPFAFPIKVLHMDLEFYNKKDWLAQWKEWTTGDFSLEVMSGMGHLTCWYKPDAKVKYLTKMTDGLKAVLAGL
mmetsp:Transcript_11053/g.20068  ORF Transcript_11053/g.20068 Transcript_11053/m.20068 type:complete len:391 (+) Transcript_11053:40-1212(+)